MSEPGETLPKCQEYLGVYSHGSVRLAAAVDWPDGTPVTVRIADVQPAELRAQLGKVIVAGFGMAGRWIANIFDRHDVDYVIVEMNPDTIETQRKLGREVIQGDITDPECLRRAGIEDASILALTIPDEKKVIEATQAARRLKPGIYIVARTYHMSAGMQCSQSGADHVIKAEQVVARQFYEMMLRKIGREHPIAVRANTVVGTNGP